MILEAVLLPSDFTWVLVAKNSAILLKSSPTTHLWRRKGGEEVV